MRRPIREKQLRVEAKITRRVDVRNLWQDVTSWSDRQLRCMANSARPAGQDLDETFGRIGEGWSQEHTSASGATLQVDRYRDDGSLLIVDRLDTKNRGEPGGRRITLLDRRRRVVGQWLTERAFYHAWLDAVFANKPSVVISDSWLTGGLVYDYRRPHVIVGHAIHSHFLKDPHGSLFGEMPPGKLDVLRNIDSFDFVTTLTDRQREDMERAHLSVGRLKTVPNVIQDMHGDPLAARRVTDGVMLAKLSVIKRVEDAVTAVALAARRVPELHLDVYGKGPEHDRLLNLVETLKASDVVTFRGHVSTARQRMLRSSFSLLTSRSEGQGLVVLESMSAGCIPIAYDLRYGPGEIIEDGVNGFLVPDGDVEALVEAIENVVALPPDQLLGMRRAAIRRAADFLGPSVVSQWGSLVAQCGFGPLTPVGKVAPRLVESVVRDGSIELQIEMSRVTDVALDAVLVSWTSRRGSYFGRVPAVLTDGTVTATIPAHAWSPLRPGLYDISIDLVAGRSFSRTRIRSDSARFQNGNDRYELYSTAYGNLSVRVTETTIREPVLL